MRICVGVADDHPVVLKGIEIVLEDYTDIEIKALYQGGRALLAGIQKHKFDVIMLDIQMPDISGDELAKIISKNYPDTKILILTNKDQSFFVKQMFKNGAAGYLLKHADPETIYEAIKTVHNGGVFLDPSLKDKISDELLDANNIQEAVPTLTRREREILELIAEGKTSPQIASILFIATSTVENHRLNLFLKLEVKNAIGLINRGKQLGLID